MPGQASTPAYRSARHTCQASQHISSPAPCAAPLGSYTALKHTPAGFAVAARSQTTRSSV